MKKLASSLSALKIPCLYIIDDSTDHWMNTPSDSNSSTTSQKHNFKLTQNFKDEILFLKKK